MEILNGSVFLEPLKLPHRHEDTYEEYLDAVRRVNVRQGQGEGGEEKEREEGGEKAQEEEREEEAQEERERSRCLLLCGIPNNKTPVEIIENSHFREYGSAIL